MSNVSGTNQQVEDFPVDVFPQAVATYIRQAATALDADVGVIGPAVLAAMAGLIGATHKAYITDDWSEPAILFMGIVGLPSSGKSPGIDYALRHVNVIEDEAVALVERLKAERPDDDLHPPQFILRDITLEGMREAHKHNGRGLLIHADELAGLFGGLGEYKKSSAGDEGRILSMYSGGPLTINRKGEGVTRIKRAACSILGGFQPATLRDVLLSDKRKANGLASRVLLSWPEDRIPSITLKSVSPIANSAMLEVCRRLAGLQFDGLPGEEVPVVVRVVEAAQQDVVRWWETVKATMREMSPAERAFAGKFRGNVLRIALVLHCAKWAARTGVELTSYAIDRATMAEAIKLADWFLAEGVRIYRALERTAEDEVDELVLGYIEQNGRATIRELSKGVWALRGKLEQVEIACHRLVNAGRLERQDYRPESGGRMVSYYFFSPIAADSLENRAGMGMGSELSLSGYQPVGDVFGGGGK